MFSTACINYGGSKLSCCDIKNTLCARTAFISAVLQREGAKTGSSVLPIFEFPAVFSVEKQVNVDVSGKLWS